MNGQREFSNGSYTNQLMYTATALCSALFTFAVAAENVTPPGGGGGGGIIADGRGGLVRMVEGVQRQ